MVARPEKTGCACPGGGDGLHAPPPGREAHLELAQASQILRKKFAEGLELAEPAQGFWFDWIFARELLRESSALHDETAFRFE
jgi:hypothetical protein